MAKGASQGGEAPLTHLTMTFDAERQTPDRITPDPHDPRRPHPDGAAPHRPMAPGLVADLF